MKFLIALTLLCVVLSEAAAPLSLLKSISELKKGSSVKQVTYYLS